MYLHYFDTLDDDLDGYYAEFEEEVLAEDGEVEEFFGYDRSAMWVSVYLHYNRCHGGSGFLWDVKCSCAGFCVQFACCKYILSCKIE